MSKDVEISGHKHEFGGDEYAGPLKKAIASFRRDYPGFTIDTIDDKWVIGWCEDCGCPLFEDSDYHESEDGIMWCKSHGGGGDDATTT